MRKKNTITCMWCGEDIVERKPKFGRLEVMGELAKHLLACKDHPLTRRIDELIKERKQLKGKITRLKQKLEELK